MNRMLHRRSSSLAIAISATVVGLGIGTAHRALADAVNENFEGFSLAPIAGQNAQWIGGNSQVVTSPGGSDGHGQVLRVDDGEGRWVFPESFASQVSVFQYDVWQVTDQERSLFMDLGDHDNTQDGPFYVFGKNDVSNRVPDNISWWDPSNFGGFGGFGPGLHYDYKAGAWQHVTIVQNLATSRFSMLIDNNLVLSDAAFRGSLSNLGQMSYSVWFGAPDYAFLDNLNVNNDLGEWNADVDGQSWSNPSNWTGNVPNGVGAVANFSGNILTADRQVLVDSPQTVGALYLTNSPHNFTIGGTAALTLDVASGSASIVSTNGNQTISSPLVLNKLTDIGVGDGGTLTLSGGVSGQGIVKSGNGLLNLSVLNSYHGSTTITAGTVAVSSSSALGDASVSNTLILQGGALQATGAVTSPVTRAVQVNSPGASIDTNGNPVNINGVISGSGALTKSGDGVLTMSASNTFTGGMTLVAGTVAAAADSNLGDPAGTVNLNGGTLLTTASITISRPIRVRAPNGGTFDTGAFNSTIGQVIGGATGGTLTKAGSGRLTSNGINSDGINVNAGTFAVAAGRALSKTSIVRSTLSVSGGALDLNDNDLVWDYSGGADSGKLSTVAGLITSAYNNGAWNGSGLASSLASSTAAHPTALGYAEASTTGLTTFDGITTDADMILVRYTYSGDSNLDGTVNALDFNALATNFGATGSVWVQGDSNYDGVVNTSDFTLLAKNFNQVQPPSAGPMTGALVPEPSTLAVIGWAASALIARRRRRI